MRRQARNRFRPTPPTLSALAALLLLMPYQQISAGITVIESTPSRLVLDWELTGFDTAAVPGVSASGKIEKRVSVYYDGGTVPTGDSAEALVYAYPIHAGVPAEGEARFSVESPEVSVIRLSAPLAQRAYRPDTSAPRFLSRWLGEPKYGMFRGYRAAQVLLRPVRDLGGGRVQLLRRARITAEFPSAPHTGESRPPSGDYELMTSRALPNFRTAQGWASSGVEMRALSGVEMHALSGVEMRALSGVEMRALSGVEMMRKTAAQSDPYPFSPSQKLARFKVGDGSRGLNEGTTDENSLIKISGAAIRKIFGTGTRISAVALYASNRGEMDVTVPNSPRDIPAGVYEVPVLRYDLNGNGIIDDGDYVIAYVSGASDWGYDRNARRFAFSINRYDDYRTYWLAVKETGDGAAMKRFGQPGNAAGAAASYEANVYMRAPRQLSEAGENHEGGIDWTWKKFSQSRADTAIQLDLPGIDKSVPGSATFSYGAMNGGSISAELGGVRLCTVCIAGERIAVRDWSSKEMIIRYSSSAASGAIYELNSVHLRYTRPITLDGATGKLEVFSANDPGIARYRLSNPGGGLAYIARVPSADGRAVELIDTVRTAEYEWNDENGSGVRYMIMLEGQITDYSDSLAPAGDKPVKNAQYQIRNLRDASSSTDYLIIAHADFLDAALKLAAHKASVGFASPKIVLVGDVFDQFGGGNTDPAAIRNFLYYVYGNWTGGGSFSYVTLMGAGHYDYKNVSTRTANFMPIPYISGRLNEDFYVFFDHVHPNSQHSCYYFIGRLPAGNPAEANDMVEKIIEMEDPRSADFSSWRSRVALAADDDQQGAAPDRTRPAHTASSEQVSRIVSAGRPDIAQKKIYLFDYGWDERYQKPAATRALINEINSGAAVVNWFGHGSPYQLADEALLTKDQVTSFENRKRYPLFSMFSCSVAKYDRPDNESLASAIIKQPAGGGIAAIASAREVYADQNEELAKPFFNALFDPKADNAVSLGGALAKAKIDYRVLNNRYYILLGDPSMKIIGRGRGIEDLRITDTAGRRIDTLKAMQRVIIKGKAAGVSEGDSVYAAVTLFNPPQDSVRRKDGGWVDTVTKYSLPGSPVFSAAKTRVGADGAFEQPVLLPMNLAFGKPGARITAYAWREKKAALGAGSLGGLIFHGTESADLSDTTGPKISVRAVYNSETMDRAGLFVKNRISAQLPATLEIKIEDESGINKIGAGPDEGITMEIKNALSKRAINHLFDFDTGSFTHGKAIVAFEENMLAAGTYDLIVSAQDLLGNVSKLSVTWDVADPSDIKLDHVTNIPNPVKMGAQTRFYYTHSNVTGDLDVQITIRIYSLGGRLLSVIRNPKNGEPWTPKDNKGNYLTPNVYLYQITAASRNVGKTVKSKIKKLAVLPPR